MGSGKVIDFDPRKRLTKEALKNIQSTVANFKSDDLANVMMIYTKQNGEVVFEAFGVDWPVLAISQAYLENLRAILLYEDTEGPSGIE